MHEDSEFRAKGTNDRKDRAWNMDTINEDGDCTLAQARELFIASNSTVEGGAIESAVEGGGAVVKNEPPPPPLSEEALLGVEISNFITSPELSLKRLQGYLIESRLLQPQAHKNRHATVLAADVEKNIAQMVKMNTAIMKLVGKPPHEIERAVVAKTLNRINAAGESHAEALRWGSRFGLDVPGAQSAAAVKRHKKKAAEKHAE